MLRLVRSPYLVLSLLACEVEPETGTSKEESPDSPSGESGDSDEVDSSSDTGEDPPDPKPAQTLTLAVIGDYGMNNATQGQVATLIDSWSPDYVLTVGDNNYQSGDYETIDANVGQYFSHYIHPYTGTYGDGADSNAFYPCPGNHDWYGQDELQPYIDYFELPGNERYYQVSLGEDDFLDVFCVDSDVHEPDGITPSSVQAEWLQSAMTSSRATWRLVTLHHAPFSSGVHGDNQSVQWPYAAWGAHTVFAGHDHNYERIFHEQMIYTVNGAGGASLRMARTPTSGTQVWDVTHHGAQRIVLEGPWMTSEFIATTGEIIDQFRVHAEHSLGWTENLVSKGASWRYLSSDAPPEDWTSTDFDDSEWSEGASPLGYGEMDLITTIADEDEVMDVPVTTWLRHHFEVDDPQRYQEMTIHLRRDDGAVVYLNGEPVFRSNLPDDVEPSTFATESVEGSDEHAFFAQNVSIDQLRAGSNLIAVEVHQDNQTAPDMSFELIVEVQGGTELVSSGDSWQWTDDEPSDWSVADFDASAWSIGPSPLGYGMESSGTETRMGAIATWFRHEFEVSSPEAYEVLLMQLKRDDGARVMLNGVEILRSNLPTGDLTGQTLAAFDVDSVWGETWIPSHVSPDLLVAGTNVIGVEVHQASDTSPDMWMDLILIGR